MPAGVATVSTARGGPDHHRWMPEPTILLAAGVVELALASDV
jgi:hypothetical protein